MKAPWHDAQCKRCRLHFECPDADPQAFCFWCRQVVKTLEGAEARLSDDLHPDSRAEIMARITAGPGSCDRVVR